MGADSAAQTHLDKVARDLVITWASSALQDEEASRRARECFEGALAMSLSVCAGGELLIVADDFQHGGKIWEKSFQHLSTSLAGRAACSRAVCVEQRLDRPSALQDVEAAYQKANCRLLSAAPIFEDSSDVLGVLSMGLPAHVPLSTQHVQTLEALAHALAPYLQQYTRQSSLASDTSVFVADTMAHCLTGCTCCACSAADNGSTSDEEWMDFDFSAYADVIEDNLGKGGADWGPSSDTAALANDMEPCTSLESMCSESWGAAGALRAKLVPGLSSPLTC